VTHGTASVQAPVTQPVMPTPPSAVPDALGGFLLAATAMGGAVFVNVDPDGPSWLASRAMAERSFRAYPVNPRPD
jgi:hypothetical protein